MEFGTVLLVICVVGAVVGVLSFWDTGSAAGGAQAQEELRQLLEAKSARRERREAPLDVEAEMAALSRPAAPPPDAALRDEVRQLVLARNERRARRARQGDPPFDVEAEVERQLSQLGGRSDI
ncbi:MAG: hypothetical protein M3350_04375 [Actinomycetota bacterium]|nr:hypothetical protein [Actinomycetota bacterium]